ncbi:S24 family peptidase [Flavobacterium covae]|uniref:LexA family transcriptional regulator n=1 Tax=Flavobacterium TaxID=237 RepID=UPI000F50C16F|nr:S24 family peptidase [Flavobacterium davisii]
MSNKIDKVFILNSLKNHMSFKKDIDFANFLGIKPTTLSSWYSRNTFDIELLYAKCNDISADWLISGKGEMLKTKNIKNLIKKNDEENNEEINKKPNVQKTSTNEETIPAIKTTNSQKGIPLLPFDAFAGLGDSSVQGVDFDTIEDRYVVPLFDGITIDFMIPVRGSSMYPKYNSGDVVACRLVNELLFVQWNKVHVIDSVSQGVIMKRLLKSAKPDSVVCKSDNKDYGEFTVPMSDIRSIALVVGVIRLE